MIRTIPVIKGRPCGSCTACCEGWLYGDAFGFEFAAGKPCKFLGGRGCSIYELRPYNPCQTFVCHWKENTSIPEWLKPDKSNVIILKRRIGKFNYLRLVSMGKSPGAEVVEWAQAAASAGQHVILTQGTEVLFFSENPEFRQEFNQEQN
jgi:Fe-S-cluster containining protein